MNNIVQGGGRGGDTVAQNPQDGLGFCGWESAQLLTICLSKILGSAPWIPDSRHSIPDFMSVELGFRTRIASWIPDSLSCIPDSKAQETSLISVPKISRYPDPNSLKTD